MSAGIKLFQIKLLHTLIWFFFVSVIFYIVYSGIMNKITLFTWIAIGLVILEGLTLVIFNMNCPLTLVAKKYSNSQKNNFDIFLPNWLAKYNKIIFTSIYLVGVLIVIYQILK